VGTGIASPIQTYLEELHARYAPLADGQVATYIPELARADPGWFGIAIATTDGHLYEVGDTRQAFTIQSISKPITYGIALEDHGVQGVLATVGVEPSGEAFNAISLAPGTGRPLNPMINAGAIATAGLVEGTSSEDRLARLLAVFSAYAGRPLAIDDAVYRSEKATGHRNRAIAHLLRNFDVLSEDPDVALDLYFRQCSIAVDCRDLAFMAATLASGGVHPRTNDRAVQGQHVESILSIMATCGMYDSAGAWVYNVGMPAKSGVGGGILAVLPGQLGIGVFSPPLDAQGNSARGIAVCRRLSRDLNLHFLRVPRVARSSVRADLTLADVGSKRLRSARERALLDAAPGRVRVFGLQGDLGFASVEAAVRRVTAAVPELETAIVDLTRVTRTDPCAAHMLRAVLVALGEDGRRLALVGTEPHASLRRAIEERLAADEQWGRLVTFPDLDAALEWAENHALDGHGADEASEVPLAEHDVCRGLSPRALALLERRLVPRHFSPNELIVRAGDPADTIYLLVHGRVSVSVEGVAGRRRVATISPGMVFGELAAINRAPRTADVRADTTVRCLALSTADFDRLGAEEPAIKIALLENLLRGVHAMVGRLNAELSAVAR
jgi:glutaminase